jgi:hypothetical protein
MHASHHRSHCVPSSSDAVLQLQPLRSPKQVFRPLASYSTLFLSSLLPVRRRSFVSDNMGRTHRCPLVGAMNLLLNDRPNSVSAADWERCVSALKGYWPSVRACRPVSMTDAFQVC